MNSWVGDRFKAAHRHAARPRSSRRAAAALRAPSPRATPHPSRAQVMGACTALFDVPDGLKTAHLCAEPNATFALHTGEMGAVTFELNGKDEL